MHITAKLIRRVSICGTILCVLLAIAYALRIHSGREHYVVTDKITLLDEVVANPSAFKGRLVTTICYLWGDGLGLSTMPSKEPRKNNLDIWRFSKHHKFGMIA